MTATYIVLFIDYSYIVLKYENVILLPPLYQVFTPKNTPKKNPKLRLICGLTGKISFFTVKKFSVKNCQALNM